MFNNYEILDKDFNKRYHGSFYQYYIQTVYGSEIITGESLLREEENNE